LGQGCAEATRAGEFQQELINNLQVGDEAGGTFGNIQGSSTPPASTGTPREKMEHLLSIALVSPFFLTLAIFIVAIAFAPAVKNEIAPATEHDHEEMDHAPSSSPEMVAVLAPSLGSERDGRMDEINMKSVPGRTLRLE
jgi:hypothetical protein